MQPYRVLIASVLKPVDDIRMARKIGLSITRHSPAEVHIAGSGTGYATSLPPLHLHPLYNFSRLSFSRALANLKFFRLGLKLRPRLLIIGTHELLPAAAALRLLLHAKLVYDVQENYYRNIWYSPAFPSGIRQPLAALVRALEYATAPLVDYYLLAERAYLHELSFVGQKICLVENKYLPTVLENPPRALPILGRSSGEIRLLYSGTIALTYGIMEAIAFTDALHKLDSRYRLHIIGFAPQPEILAKVKKAIAGKPYITLTGGEMPVPHPQIVAAIAESDFGLLPYQPNPGIDNCIPTKLYEYLANALPIIARFNPNWNSLLSKWDAGFSISFNPADADQAHQKIRNVTFFTRGKPENVTWPEEEERLLKTLIINGLPTIVYNI